MSSPPKMAQKPGIPQLPRRDAPAATVREYLEAILIDCFSTARPEAIEIAAKWRFGRGAELTSFKIEEYRAIFGFEAGTILFRHIYGKEIPPKLESKSEDDLVKKNFFGQEPACKF